MAGSILTAFAMISTVTGAAIPTAGGTIVSCYATAGSVLRVVNSSSECLPAETALTWSQKGPQGPVGPEGPVASDRDRAPAPILLRTIDSTVGAGAFPSMTIGTDGFPLISYYNETSQDLMVAHCSNATCSSVTRTAVDTAGRVGEWSSITIGSDGLGLISYHDNTNADLKVAHCTNVACTSSTRLTADATGSVGVFTSITIGEDGTGQISYFDVTNGDLKVAECVNVACSSVTRSTVASTGIVGQVTTIALGTGARTVIAFRDNAAGLRVASCLMPCVSTPIVTVAAGSIGEATTMTIGSDAFPLIVHHDAGLGALKVLHCTTATCSSVSSGASLMSGSATGTSASVTVGADGLAVIAYHVPATGEIRVARCTDVACSQVTTNLVASPGAVERLAITIGNDGLPVIAYFNEVPGNLGFIACPNVFCAPHFRRR